MHVITSGYAPTSEDEALENLARDFVQGCYQPGALARWMMLEQAITLETYMRQVHYPRVNELIEANNRNVELRRSETAKVVALEVKLLEVELALHACAINLAEAELQLAVRAAQIREIHTKVAELAEKMGIA